MIDWALAGKVATVIATPFVVRFLWKRSADPNPLTVEQEEEERRAIIASIPQKYPATRDADEYEAPQWALVDQIHRTNCSSL